MDLTNEQVLDVMLQRKPETTVPFSVWHHFTPVEFFDGLKKPEGVKQSLAGLKKYVDDVDPDFVKLMTDGFFHFPLPGVEDPNDPDQLAKLQEIPADDPWIKAQVDLIKQQLEVVHGKLAFYNIFSPLTYFKWALINFDPSNLAEGDKRFGELYAKAPQVVEDALAKIAVGDKRLVQAVAKTGVEGIYYSTQTIQAPDLIDNHDFFTNVHEKIDLDVSQEIDQDFEVNILHICGFEGFRNHLQWFTKYPYKVVNYAVNAEKVPLAEGKKIFPKQVILGGLDITKDGTLYIDVPEDAANNAVKIVKNAGKDRLILGADCTIQRETPVVNITTVRDAVHQL